MAEHAKIEAATLGGGCFWCLDAVYRGVKGVKDVISGYAGGQVENPTYEQVSSGGTGHAEVVQVEFDPNAVGYRQLLQIFWYIHDPTTPGRQGNDVGPQYRSIILYDSDEQRRLAENSKATDAKELWDDPILTEIAPLKQFYRAEEYHQDYFRKNPTQAYCQVVINPKLKHFREKFSQLLS